MLDKWDADPHKLTKRYSFAEEEATRKCSLKMKGNRHCGGNLTFDPSSQDEKVNRKRDLKI